MEITVKIKYGKDKELEASIDEFKELQQAINELFSPTDPIKEFWERMELELKENKKETIYVPYPYNPIYPSYEPIYVDDRLGIGLA